MTSTYENLVAQVREAADAPAALELLDAAIAVAAESAVAGDRLLDHFVAQARQAGHSWTEVGTRFGVSKQAARQRFVELERDVNCSPGRRGGRWKRARTSAGAVCSFCERSEQQVAGHLVAGPGVYICSACVRLSAEIIEQERRP